MSIPTRQCIVGQIASRPEWSRASEGTVRFFARIKIRARRRHADGTYGDPVESFHNLVAYGRAAERGRTRVREGDVIVAAGYVRTDSYDHDGAPRTGEEFVMRWFGHEAWRTEYTVARSAPPAQPSSHPRTPRRSSVAAIAAQGPAPALAR
ncbi:single-stranded DNA-binding protein [Cellulomonas sp. ATA003]|uniref:single-stranded DNA-binding protein n=1 Tax=Cellulomonas sp. ATA003 TaxID=3073064 RepID=UPI002873685D|nr:single-stranded DNA-binding protein [Cellulomonas sp. ATA003]WNB86438.1 single-stranded DNA-binding protein [Cellulomonas sp. ATA003]